MMKLNKIKKVKLHSEVARIINNYITENKLQTSDKLPSERELAEKLGIGRSSLREALRVLESQGIVEVVSGKGIFVGLRNEPITTLANLSMKLEKKMTLLELYQVRRPLGSLSIELAAVNASDEQILEIGKHLAAYEQVHAQGLDGSDQDRLFHMAIHKASGNFLIATLFEFIFFHWDNFHFDKETAYPESVPLHRPIYEAIKNREPKMAVKAYHRLMDYVEKLILKPITKNN